MNWTFRVGSTVVLGTILDSHKTVRHVHRGTVQTEKVGLNKVPGHRNERHICP